MLITAYLAQPSPLAARLFHAAGIDGANPHLLALAASLLGAVIGGGLLWGVAEAYLRLRGIEGMGFGDVKMMAMVGAFLGAPLALLTIMLGSLAGSVIGLIFISSPIKRVSTNCRSEHFSALQALWRSFTEKTSSAGTLTT